jgi:hypothetical protein
LTKSIYASLGVRLQLILPYDNKYSGIVGIPLLNRRMGYLLVGLVADRFQSIRDPLEKIVAIGF